MSEPLEQAVADELRVMRKRLTEESWRACQVPLPGESLQLIATSLDTRQEFNIDVNRRGRIKITRCSYLERHQTVTVLARLDINGAPHTNPRVAEVPVDMLAEYNGLRIECPHFHFYVTDFEDRWAIPAHVAGFTEEDLAGLMRQFLVHCGVLEIPNIQLAMV